MIKNMKFNNWSNSSFWLDEDFTSSGNSIFDDYDEKPKVDLLKLAGYRRAIANFVSIVTGQSIPVQFSGADSYTDGKRVNISAKLTDKEFDSAVGLALHEGSHIKLTDFKLLADLEDNIPSYLIDMISDKYYSDREDVDKVWMTKNYIRKYVGDLLNIVEDRRIDNYVYKAAPGYRGYYEALYNKYFNAKIIDKGLQSDEYTEANWESYMFRICNITNPNRRLDIMNFRNIWNILDLKNIDRLESSKDALDVAYEIFDFVESQIPKPEKTECENDCDGENGEHGYGCNANDPYGEPKEGNGEHGNINDDGSKAEGEEAVKGSSSKQGGAKMPEMTPRQHEQLKKAIKKQEEFLKQEVKKKKLSKKDEKAMKAMEESGISVENVDYDRETWSGDKINQKQEVYVVRDVTQSLIDSNQFDGMWAKDHWRQSENEIAIKEGIVLGKMLGKKLKVRAEEKNTKFNRLRTGKIDNRMLASCGYGNESIFEKIESFAYRPGIIHISIDNSGSMNGNRLLQTMKTTMAIAKACSMIENMDVVVSFRAADNVGGNRNMYMPVIGIIYDSRKHHINKLARIMPQVRACGTTPEGLCFKAIMKELISGTRGKDAYFINMCDGMPWFNNYGGDNALNHTRQQVTKMRREGIKVLSYFIGGSGYGSQKEDFQKMYGKDSQFIDTNNLVSLAKTMNNKFLEVA